MMDKKYVIHPGVYAIGENETLYAKLAAKGWMLDKRGGIFSRFYKAEPRKLQYRAELSNSKLYDDDEMRDKQISLYRESGWTYVTGKGVQNIFSASEGLEAPDVYSEPEQRKAALKILRRNYSNTWLSFVLYLLIFPLMSVLSKSAFSESMTGALQSLIYMWQRIYFELTAFVLLLAAFLLYQLIHSVYAYRAYRIFKKDGHLNHEPGRRPLPYKAARVVLAVCCLVFLALSIIQWANRQKYEMPAQADGPYLLLKDLGWEGERSKVFTSGPDSTVTVSRSMLLKHWDTYECVEAKDKQYWMYQDIYEMKSHISAVDFVSILTKIPSFPRAQDYLPIKAEGLDFAYRAGNDYIAVRENFVCRITYYEPVEHADGDPQADVFAALAAMLEKHT